MRAGLGVALVCFASTLVYCAGAEEGATKPTPPEVIDAIKKLGGRVKVDKNKAVVSVFFPTLQTVTDTELVHLKELTELEELGLHGTDVTDAGLVHLKGLTKLKELHLPDTKVTDAGLVHLKGLAGLKNLNLTYNNVADAGLVHLKELTKLQRLNLAATGPDSRQQHRLIGSVFTDRQIVQRIQCRNVIDCIHRDIKRPTESGVVTGCIQIAIQSTVFHCHRNRGGPALVGEWRQFKQARFVCRCVGYRRIGNETGIAAGGHLQWLRLPGTGGDT